MSVNDEYRTAVLGRIKTTAAYLTPTLLIFAFLIIKQPYGGLELPLRFRNAVECSAFVPIHLTYLAGLTPPQDVRYDAVVSISFWIIFLTALLITPMWRLKQSIHISAGITIAIANFLAMMSIYI